MIVHRKNDDSNDFEQDEFSDEENLNPKDTCLKVCYFLFFKHDV